MNDDARFFFCISGFAGFVLFLLFGFLISGDFLVALVQSAFGCLFFAICGRFLLCFILNGILVESVSSSLPNTSKETASTSSDPLQMAKVAMNEASTTAKPVVEAQA
ncbi:MAG: hypothetical protein P8O23_00825 [Opitutales bacterium]|nr:hypothetical protein [Opitutales bacterium]